GHRSRLLVLRELLAHIASHRDVWFATHAQIADIAYAQIGTTHPDPASGNTS
ncbi:MAG: peptidoglycan-N-acetylglucosamine deacetylase, partial [Pseudonocardiales bacterium]|nr:peptidoglycan-N-acetylglucosamine deacetylase [Pseudonocardiales bacterium]